MNAYLEQLNYGWAALPAAILLLTASLGTGLAVLRHLFRIKAEDSLSYGIVALIAGLDLLALMVLGAGSIGILGPKLIWTGLILLSLPLLPFIPETAGALWRFIYRHRLFTLLLAMGFLLILGSALCYPYSWDENSYQAAIPYRWIQAGNLEVFMDNPYSAFPSLPQFITRLFLEIGGIFMPRIICCVLYGVFFLALYRILSIYTARLYAAIITAALFLSPVFMIMMRETYAEPHMLVNLAAVFLLPYAIGRKSKDRTWLLSGLFCGAAMAVKLTGAGLVPPVLIYLWFMTPEIRRQPAGLLRKAVLFGLAAFAFSLPFYLRTFLYTGNPFYPFLTSLFGMPAADRLVDLFHHAMGDRYFGLKTSSSFFTGPILAAVYDLYAPGDNALFDGIALGWQFILLLGGGLAGGILCLRSGRKDSALAGILCMLGIFYMFWFFSSQQTRFILPAYLFAALLAARSLRLFRPRYVNCFLGILLFATLYNTQWVNIRHFKTSWQVACGQRNPEYFLKQTIRDPGYIEALAFLEAQTPPEAKVMMILERRGLYMPRRYEIAAPYFQSKYLTPVPAAAADLAGVLAASGADYVFAGVTRVNLDHIADFDEENNRLLNMVAELEKEQFLELKFQMDYFWVFKITGKP